MLTGALKAVLEDVKPGAKVVDLCRKGDKIIEECVPHCSIVSSLASSKCWYGSSNVEHLWVTWEEAASGVLESVGLWRSQVAYFLFSPRTWTVSVIQSAVEWFFNSWGWEVWRGVVWCVRSLLSLRLQEA